MDPSILSTMLRWTPTRRSAKDCQKLIGAAALRPQKGYARDGEVREDLERTVPQYPRFYRQFWLSTSKFSRLRGWIMHHGLTDTPMNFLSHSVTKNKSEHLKDGVQQIRRDPGILGSGVVKNRSKNKPRLGQQLAGDFRRGWVGIG